MLVVGYCLLFVVCCFLCVVYDVLFVVCYLSFVVGCLSSVVCYVLRLLFHYHMSVLIVVCVV